MKPILIIAQEAGGIPFGLKKGFENLGFICLLETYDETIFSNKHSLIERIYHRIADPGYQKEIKLLFNKTVEKYGQEISDGGFSFVLIMRGNEIEEKNLNTLNRRKCNLFTYLYDPLTDSTIQKQCADISDFIFCADKKDCSLYKNNSCWLPLGYDDEVYFPSTEEKDIDIFISGSISNRYFKRREIVEKIGKSSIAKNKKIFFIGSTGFSLTDLKVNVGKINWIAKRVSHFEIANYQRRAKICVNIHRDDSDSIVNPSFFSIPGSGSCQIAEKRDSLKYFMTPEKEYVEFENFEQLIILLEKLLEDEEKRNLISLNSFQKVKREHTLLCRAKYIIQKWREINNA